jgi:hypothetical protein
MAVDFDRQTGEIAALYNRSSELHELFAALAKAQAVFENAEKAKLNLAYKTKYATLESVLDATRKGREENALAVVQMPGNAGPNIAVTTILGHSSGQWIESTFAVAPTKYDAQGAGSVVTYLRRYALMSILGIAPEDDDGNAAVSQPAPIATRVNPAVAKPSPDADVARAAVQRIRKEISSCMFIEQLNERGLNGPSAADDESHIRAQSGGDRVWADLVQRDADKRLELAQHTEAS